MFRLFLIAFCSLSTLRLNAANSPSPRSLCHYKPLVTCFAHLKTAAYLDNILDSRFPVFGVNIKSELRDAMNLLGDHIKLEERPILQSHIQQKVGEFLDLMEEYTRDYDYDLLEIILRQSMNVLKPNGVLVARNKQIGSILTNRIEAMIDIVHSRNVKARFIETSVLVIPIGFVFSLLMFVVGQSLQDFSYFM